MEKDNPGLEGAQLKGERHKVANNAGPFAEFADSDNKRHKGW